MPPLTSDDADAMIAFLQRLRQIGIKTYEGPTPSTVIRVEFESARDLAFKDAQPQIKQPSKEDEGETRVSDIEAALHAVQRPQDYFPVGAEERSSNNE